MPKKSATFPTEDMVLWHRVTSQVTPLKSRTQLPLLANQGADATRRKNKASKNNIKTQKE